MDPLISAPYLDAVALNAFNEGAKGGATMILKALRVISAAAPSMAVSDALQMIERSIENSGALKPLDIADFERARREMHNS